MVKKEWREKGYVSEPIPQGTNIKAEIRRMCEEKNAVILAHYYTDKPLQEIADLLATVWLWHARQPRRMLISL